VPNNQFQTPATNSKNPLPNPSDNFAVGLERADFSREEKKVFVGAGHGLSGAIFHGR
jgi:hypothetical protein